MRLQVFRRLAEMNRSFTFYCFILVVGCSKTSTDVEPEYTLAEPMLKFEKSEFRTSKDPAAPDTLVVAMTILDGDGDYGLDQVAAPPYNWRNVVLKADGTSIDLNAVGKTTPLSQVIKYSDRKNSPLDTLPKFVQPFNCTRWSVAPFSDGQKQVVDTVYTRFNKYFYNLTVDLLYESSPGQWVVYDIEKAFGYPQCASPFSGRVPQLSSNPTSFGSIYQSGPFTLIQVSKTSLHAVVRFQSNFYRIVFKGKKIKLRMFATDREFHDSNTIETDEFQM